MKKAAIFVEGQTELIFVRRLLEEIAGINNITFIEEQKHGRSYISLSAKSTETMEDRPYSILIVNCCSDGAVATAIKDRHAGLRANNYDIILGLRDLYPSNYADLLSLKTKLHSILPTANPPAKITIAIAEVEAWFLQENKHFAFINPACTKQAIRAATGYDIDVDMAETQFKPSKTLDDAYKVGGERYSKKKWSTHRTVFALDYAHLYLDRRKMLSSFDEFVTEIENFLE